MNLLIDAGNSRIKWALVADGLWQTGACQRADFAEQLQAQLIASSPIEKILISSTRNQTYNSQLAALLQDLFDLECEFIKPVRRGCSLLNRYQPEDSLGSDRWAAMIAAHALSSAPAIVIDCGTAVTIDAVNAEGIFEGGVIFPGFRLALQALNQADNLPETTAVEASVFAQNTNQAMYSGVLNSIIGGIDAIVIKMRQQLGYSVKVYLCGGDMGLVESQLQHSVIAEPDLVLKGLQIISGAQQ